jgi:hypothetical protein
MMGPLTAMTPSIWLGRWLLVASLWYSCYNQLYEFPHTSRPQFFVVCEPALSSYSVCPPCAHAGFPAVVWTLIPLQYATDFYKALINITSGIMLPLTTADLLVHAIVGLVLENLDMECLVREVGQAIAQRILGIVHSMGLETRVGTWVWAWWVWVWV